MLFFVGMHEINHVHHFARSFVSVNRLINRKSDFTANDWILDSGAFTQISTHGCFKMTVQEYADHVLRWESNKTLLRAVSQDWMCEEFMLDITGKTVVEHQELTIKNYLELKELCGGLVMPVLQGYTVDEYQRHVTMYGDELSFGQWVGVGSVCKRNSNPSSIIAILRGIREVRPDLNLHGFGIKKTSLQLAPVHDILYSADSMAWSYSARMQGRNGSDWREAEAFECNINNQMIQESLL